MGKGDEMTTITVKVEDGGESVSISGGDELDIESITNLWGRVLLALGYGSECVNNVLNTDEFGNEEED
jgi:hypothetical protein